MDYQQVSFKFLKEQDSYYFRLVDNETFVTTTQFHSCILKATIDNMSTNGCV